MVICTHLLGIKNFNFLIKTFYPLRNLNTGQILKIKDFDYKNKTHLLFYRDLIPSFTRNIDVMSLSETNSLLKLALYSKYSLDKLASYKILSNLGKNYNDDRLLSLDILYNLLLLTPTFDLSPSKCVEFLGNFRSSTDIHHQLKLLNIFYSIQFYHPHFQSHYTSQMENFVEYLKALSPKIRLSCGIPEDSEDILEVKSTMDFLKVEYYSGITGHIYSPIILKGTNMVIDIACERFEIFSYLNFRDFYPDSEEYIPSISLRQLIMKNMGWKIRFIPKYEWMCNDTDERKKEYLSKFISEYYMKTQFRQDPPFVSL